MTNETETARRGTQWLVVGSLAVFALAVAYVFGRPVWEGGAPEEIEIAPARLLAKSREALEQQRYDDAFRFAGRALKQLPQSADALLLAGEALQRRGDAKQAVEHYLRVPTDAGENYVKAQWAAGNSLLHQGRLGEAEACFRIALKRDPNNVIALRRLVFILSIEGRRRESIDYLYQLIRLQQIAFEELTILADLQQPVAASNVLSESLKQVPEDVRPMLGQAALLRRENKWDESAEVIRKLVEADPSHLDAQAELGRWYLEEDPQAFLQWHAQLPEAAQQHPEIWYVRGAWAQDHRLLKEALRCYWETLSIHPSHAEANFRIAQVLQSMDRPEAAKEFLDRYRVIEELLETLKPLRLKGPEFEPIVKVAGFLERLGRLWEAWGWYGEALRLRPAEAELRLELDRLAARLSQDPPRVIPSANPILKYDFSNHPLPKIESRAAPIAETGSGVRFTDMAVDVGVHFQYTSGDDPKTPGFQIYQEFGGGIGVLDFDGDGWQDLYLAQGSQWPPRDGQQDHLDRMLRNIDGSSFVDVTRAAGLGDERFSQGLAVGDFNNDGFADLFVANIGGNRLYRNEGDGTFTEVTKEEISGQLWTTSCVMVDVTGDGFPDIYEVNYLQGPEVFERVCRENGVVMACHPRSFDPAQDQLYVNLGDGRFRNATQVAGIVNDHGKGLGIVAADFNRDQRLDLFIANDTTANGFLLNRGESRDQDVRFEDQALVSGVAYDSDGRPQACMGVAVSDLDSDGMLELFVTNFYRESNTLYRQVSEEFFVDATWSAGLRDSSRKMLGFGTQFLDSDLDGFPDLVVANGHVSDRTKQEPPDPFRMRPQYYHNLGDGRFQLSKNDAVGTYFNQKLLGRSLALVDFDRDGRPDFSVMDLYEDVQLLHNESQDVGHFVKLYLRGGRDSGRDAIRARVELKLGDRVVRRQLVAGDGFQCSNERVLHVGLGTAQEIDRVTIQWMSGASQSIGPLVANREYVIVEGHQAASVTAVVSRLGDVIIDDS